MALMLALALAEYKGEETSEATLFSCVAMFIKKQRELASQCKTQRRDVAMRCKTLATCLFSCTEHLILRVRVGSLRCLLFWRHVAASLQDEHSNV